MSFALRLELRRSPLRWWLPLLIALDLCMLFSRSTAWIGVWPQTSAAAQLPAYFLSVALAAGAAWTAGRTGASDQHAMAVRPLRQAHVARLGSLLVYGLVAYLPGVVVAAAVTYRRTQPGFLWPSYLLIGVSLIAISTALGYLVGRLTRTNHWPPVAAILIMLFLLQLPSGKDGLLHVLSGRPQLEVAIPALASRFLLAASLVTVAVCLPDRRVAVAVRPGHLRQRKRLTAAMAALAMVSLVLVALAGPLRRQRPAPANPICTETAPKICLWPENGKYLPVAAKMATNIAILPPGLVRVPSVINERGLTDTADGISLDLSTWGMASGISAAILDATLTDHCRPHPVDAKRKYTAVFELDAWLAATAFGRSQPSDIGGGPDIDMAAVTAVTSQPMADQASWVTDRLTTIRQIPCA